MLDSVFLIFDIGGGEIMLIMLVILLLFGGEKLPQLARGLGKGIRDFKDASEGVKREITNQIDSYETKKAQEAEATKPAEKATTEEKKEGDTNERPPVVNTMPVSEIGSTAEVEPVDHSPEHLRET